MIALHSKKEEKLLAITDTGLYGQPPAGPQLAGHAAAHRLSSRPAARAEANRLTRHEIDAMKR